MFYHVCEDQVQDAVIIALLIFVINKKQENLQPYNIKLSWNYVKYHDHLMKSREILNRTGGGGSREAFDPPIQKICVYGCQLNVYVTKISTQ